MQGYMDIFQSEELPTPMTILQATAEVNNLAAQINALDMYNKEMDDVRTTTVEECLMGYFYTKSMPVSTDMTDPICWKILIAKRQPFT